MNKEKYNQIIDEAYENYITQTRIEFEKWRERNPYTLVDYREDTKELFLKSIKEDTHWFTGEKKFSEKWGLEIEERELSLKEKEYQLEKTNCINDIENDRIIYGHEWEKYIQEQYEGIQSNQDIKIPTKHITITYNGETIESYE